MKKIIYAVALIIILLFAGVFCLYLMDNDGHLNEKDAELLGISKEKHTEITLFSNSPVNLYTLLYQIRNEAYYEGYDNDTFVWMRSLGQKEVFISENSYVIMDKNDAKKIHRDYVTDTVTTDTYNEYYIDCVVVENRSLGGNSHKDILLVKDVNYHGNQTFYYQV